MSYSIESITESIGARRVGNVPATIDWLGPHNRSPEGNHRLAAHRQPFPEFS